MLARVNKVPNGIAKSISCVWNIVYGTKFHIFNHISWSVSKIVYVTMDLWVMQEYMIRYC